MRIRVIDIETSHGSPEAGGVCEIGFCDVVSRMTDLAGGPCDWTVEPGGACLCNPGVAIPPLTAAIHHIIDADVAGLRPWQRVVREFLFGSVGIDRVDLFAAHGADYEKRWLQSVWPEENFPFRMIDTYKTALRVWRDAPLHSNMGLRYWRMPEGMDRAMAQPAHRAGPDSYVTAFLLRDMLEKAVPEQMLEWSAEPALTLRCFIGDYRNGGLGTPWEEVDSSMLHWILEKDFPEDIRFTVRHHLERRRRQAEEANARMALNAQLRANGLPEEPVEEFPI